MKNHCTARLMSSTLGIPERRIGHCGDATRAPTQKPEWQEAAPAASTPNHSGPKAINPGGLGACVREDLMDLLIERNQLG